MMDNRTKLVDVWSHAADSFKDILEPYDEMIAKQQSEIEQLRLELDAAKQKEQALVSENDRLRLEVDEAKRMEQELVLDNNRLRSLLNKKGASQEPATVALQENQLATSTEEESVVDLTTDSIAPIRSNSEPRQPILLLQNSHRTMSGQTRLNTAAFKKRRVLPVIFTRKDDKPEQKLVQDQFVKPAKPLVEADRPKSPIIGRDLSAQVEVSHVDVPMDNVEVNEPQPVKHDSSKKQPAVFAPMDDSYNLVPSKRRELERQRQPVVEVVRRKADRMQFAGESCSECRGFFAAVGHHHCQAASRHRANQHIPSTPNPEIYWAAGIPDTPMESLPKTSTLKKQRKRRRRPLLASIPVEEGAGTSTTENNE